MVHSATTQCEEKSPMTADPKIPPSRPFYALLGIHPLEAQDGRSVVVLEENPALGNSRGEVHGGAIYSLLDVAAASAARSTQPGSGGAATINLTVTYMVAGRGRLTAHGLVLRAGKTIIAVEAEAKDESGTLVAKAHGTMRTRRA